MWVKKCVKICIMLFKNWKILPKMPFHGPSYKIYVFFWKSRHVATFVVPQFSFHVYVASVLSRLLDSRKVGYGFTFFTCTVSAKFYFIFIFLKERKKKEKLKLKLCSKYNQIIGLSGPLFYYFWFILFEERTVNFFDGEKIYLEREEN